MHQSGLGLGRIHPVDQALWACCAAQPFNRYAVPVGARLAGDGLHSSPKVSDCLGESYPAQARFGA